MRYVLLLESAYDNGKLCSFSHRAFRLWANSLSYARKHRTDGHLSTAQAAVLLRLYQLTSRDAEELVTKGGWELVDDGYRIHDFLDVNPTEEELDAVTEARVEAGRVGGLRSGAARRQRAHAEASASPKQPDSLKQTRSKTEAKRTNIDIEKERDRDLENQTSLPAVAAAPEAAAAGVHALTKPSSTSDQGAVGADFDAWWVTYPRHEVKLAARKSYEARRAAGRSAEALLAAARHLAAYVDEYATPTDKIPHATTFLNQHRDEEWERGAPDAGRRIRANGRRPIPNPIDEARTRLLARQAEQVTDQTRRALA
jgi:hypothetical protein